MTDMSFLYNSILIERMENIYLLMQIEAFGISILFIGINLFSPMKHKWFSIFLMLFFLPFGDVILLLSCGCIKRIPLSSHILHVEKFLFWLIYFMLVISWAGQIYPFLHTDLNHLIIRATLYHSVYFFLFCLRLCIILCCFPWPINFYLTMWLI